MKMKASGKIWLLKVAWAPFKSYLAN